MLGALGLGFSGFFHGVLQGFSSGSVHGSSKLYGEPLEDERFVEELFRVKKGLFPRRVQASV